MNPEERGLLTDLYQLTMAQCYFQGSMFAPATFSLFIRKYPPDRSYFVAAGLDDVIRYLEEWRFPGDSTEYLRSTGIFSEGFLEYLSGVRFTGDVWAIPEGRLFFTDEPILEVTAPIPEAQIVETFIINQVNFQSLVATKAARCVWAARGKELVDFSLRRTQGIDAGMKAARACHIAGFSATSNVLASKVYGIPPSGTMAHSLVTSYEHELDAFRDFAASFPERTVLLIDTYDTLSGARKAALVGKEMEARGQRLRGVRLDSGDMDSLSRGVREILDDAGLGYVTIFATGGLEEFDVDSLVRSGAPIDGFGLGTRMGVSADAPWTDMAYKLVQYGERPVLKLSTGKASLPAAKQVFRRSDDAGHFNKDIISLRHESQDMDGGEPLLTKVMEGGRIVGQPPSLNEIRSRFRSDYERLPDRFKALQDPPLYPVSSSRLLKVLHSRLQEETTSREVTSPSGLQGDVRR